MAGVLVAVARRHQHVDRLPDQLGARIPEQPLGLAVGEQDLAVAPDDHHRVGSGLEERGDVAGDRQAQIVERRILIGGHGCLTGTRRPYRGIWSQPSA